MFNSFALGNSFNFKKLNESVKDRRKIEQSIINNWIEKDKPSIDYVQKYKDRSKRKNLLMNKIINERALDSCPREISCNNS